MHANRITAVYCIFSLVGAAPAADPPLPVLHLVDGGFVQGQLCGSHEPKLLIWRSPLFVRPLEFPLSVVKNVDYPALAKPPQPAGEYCFEMADGDVLFGDLVGLTDVDLAVDAKQFGRWHLRRDQVRRMTRRGDAASIYVGPNGLAGWTDPAPTPQWRDQGGQLATKQPATLYRNLGLPDKALIEVDLSWQTKADFVFAVGVDARDGPVRNCFRFEVWDGMIVLVGESNRDADVVVLQEAGALGGELRVQMYLDQPQHRLILVSRTGKLLADLHIQPDKPAAQKNLLAALKNWGNQSPVQKGVPLTNGQGDVCLEHLRVTAWNGVPPGDVARRSSARAADGRLDRLRPARGLQSGIEGIHRSRRCDEHRRPARCAGRGVPDADRR